IDMQHHIWLMVTDGQLYLALLDKKKVKIVLDIGTGTGAQSSVPSFQFPVVMTEIIGSDLSPCQPSLVPPNCKFEIDDSKEDWTYDQKFDYIYGRVLVAAFKDFFKVFRQAYEHM
ncbi:S-adenosyl-L-methionine-dependent methyltransferase, partial [Lineolata rhizophorae]